MPSILFTRLHLTLPDLRHREKYKQMEVEVTVNGKKSKRNLFLLQVTAPVAGKLVGLMLPVGMKVQSYTLMAWIDVGEKDWDQSLLPVAEWPDAG